MRAEKRSSADSLSSLAASFAAPGAAPCATVVPVVAAADGDWLKSTTMAGACGSEVGTCGEICTCAGWAVWMIAGAGAAATIGKGLGSTGAGGATAATCGAGVWRAVR